MLEKIIALDKKVFIFLNGLGSPAWDGFLQIVTKQLNWAPLFLLVFYLLYKKIGWKNLGLVLLFIAVLILFCDQTCNLFKRTFERLRPCNTPDIKDFIRIVERRDSFSFFSGHAANSMASTVFVFSIFRKYYKHAYLLFLFPLIFAYSRIYLGLHFPIDILTGYAFGATFGWLMSKAYVYYHSRYRAAK